MLLPLLTLKASLMTQNFGKPLSQFLSEKITAQTDISLVEKGKLFWNKTEIAKIFTDFFKNAVNQLTINTNEANFNAKSVLSNNQILM